MKALDIQVNDTITLTRKRDNAVRHGRVDRLQKVGQRTIIKLHQPERENKFGSYYIDECEIVRH